MALDPITAGITAAGEIVKLLDTELVALNSPAAIEARKNVDVQKRRDQNTIDAEQGLKTGNATKINEDLS